MQARSLLFLFFYWLAFNLLVLHTPFTIFNGPDVKPVQNVEYLASHAVSPEDLSNENWQEVALPDDWYVNHKNINQIWYRTQVLIRQEVTGIWAVYIPSVTHNAAVFVNDIWVGQGGSFNEPVSRHHNDPLLFSFSSELLRQGKNKIEIRVKTSFYEQGLFDQFYLAPVNDLKDAYSWKHFVRVDLVQWFTMAMYLLSGVVLVFWLARPQDVIYGLFSLELFIWASHNLNLFVTEIPVSICIWESFNVATLGWTVTVMILFNHRFVGEGNKKLEKYLLFFSVLGIGIFLLPDIESILHIGYRVWDVFVMIAGMYAIYYLIKTYAHKKSSDVYLMLIVGVPILVFGFHDILMINHFIDRRDGLTMQYSIIPSVILFSWFMVRRFVHSINKAERLAETLEQRVQQKQQKLQAQYERLSSMQKESVLAEERERIMRDMHDGIGGHLVSVITLLQGYSDDVFVRVREKVQHSLSDLRFVIDSLDPLLNDIPTLLGMMRMRLVDQLEDASIELEWAVTELPEIKTMSPRRSLHIMRIVQEAITNSIKHSGSKKMTIATGVINNDMQKVYIDIIDYGRGVDKESSIPGRGINNMHYRAEQLDAELVITHSSAGTKVRLLINVM
jgi:signal transduction histidine kinase